MAESAVLGLALLTLHVLVVVEPLFAGGAGSHALAVEAVGQAGPAEVDVGLLRVLLEHVCLVVGHLEAAERAHFAALRGL